MKIDLVCIGTPRVTGDAIGPRIGTLLQDCRFTFDAMVHGTVDNPITGLNYSERIKEVREDALVVAIDAAMTSDDKRLYTYELSKEQVKPGKALNKVVTPVGDLAFKIYTAKHYGDNDLLNKLALLVASEEKIESLTVDAVKYLQETLEEIAAGLDL